MVELEFQDHYVLAVLALLWLLCFCRTILDSCGSCLQVADGCIAEATNNGLIDAKPAI